MKFLFPIFYLLSAISLFAQGSRPPVTTLSGLTDVFIASPANGQMLTWNAGTSKWNNGPVPVPTLTSLGDVAIVSAANSQVLRWDSVSGKWVNYGPLAFSDVTGTVTPAQMHSTFGTASGATYYRGDGAWGPGGGSASVGTVAALPASPATGQLAAVTDGAASLAWGATVTGGGSTMYLCWWNSVNWTVVGK
jgi:hypothetical protein